MIEHLPTLTPDMARNARTIARCHDRLDRRHAGRRAAPASMIERTALLGFGVIYLSSLAFDVVRMLTS